MIGKLASGSERMRPPRSVFPPSQPDRGECRDFGGPRLALPGVESVVELVFLLIAHTLEREPPGGEIRFEVAMGGIALQEADRAPRQIGRTLHRGISRDYQCGRLVENGRPGDEEAGERLVDDLGAAEKEDVVAPLPDGVEGPVGIVDADRSLDGSAGGGDPDRATEIDEQASWGAVGRWHEQPGSRHGAAANDAARLDAIEHGPRPSDRGETDDDGRRERQYRTPRPGRHGPPRAMSGRNADIRISWLAVLLNS